MKTENDFNSDITSWFKKQLSPHYHAVKIADKYQVGISDFLIWGEGKSVPLESKYIREFPAAGSKLLKHPFTAEQMVFLRQLYTAGTLGYGSIGVASEKMIYMIPYPLLQTNWTTQEFLEHAPHIATKVPFGDAHGMRDVLFGRTREKRS